MKTYVRKKRDETGSKIIEDVKDLCRLCLSKSENNVLIFDDNIAISLSIRIMTCVGLEVNDNELLPKYICESCYAELNRCYSFRKKCENVDQRLKLHLQALKEKDLAEAKSKVLELHKRNVLHPPNSDQKIKDEYAKVTQDLKPPTFSIEKNTSNARTAPLKQSVLKTGLDQIRPVIIGNEKNKASKEMQEERLGSLIRTALILSETVRAENDVLVFPVLPDTLLEVTTLDGSLVTMQLVEENGETEEAETSFPVDKEEPKDLKYTCAYCCSVFPDRISLRKHLILHTGKRKGVSCWHCGKWFSTRSAQARHERIHTGEKPYSCRVCHRSFAQKEILQRHQLVHLDKRPFQCDSCDKSFTQREALRVHARSHAPPATRPLHLHRCSLCPKMFCYASGLSRHMMMHTGRQFTCSDCNKTFSDKSSMRRHIKMAQHLSPCANPAPTGPEEKPVHCSDLSSTTD